MSSNIPIGQQNIPANQNNEPTIVVASVTNFEGKKKCARCPQAFPLHAPFRRAKIKPKHSGQASEIELCLDCYSHLKAKPSTVIRSQVAQPGKFNTSSRVLRVSMR